MKIEEQHQNCHYWGYEPASAEFLYTPMDREKKRTIQEKHKADRAAIKAAGRKPSDMGYRSKIAAIDCAEITEEVTGVEMRVFSHDYL